MASVSPLSSVYVCTLVTAPSWLTQTKLTKTTAKVVIVACIVLRAVKTHSSACLAHRRAKHDNDCRTAARIDYVVPGSLKMKPKLSNRTKLSTGTRTTCTIQCPTTMSMYYICYILMEEMKIHLEMLNRAIYFDNHRKLQTMQDVGASCVIENLSNSRNGGSRKKMRWPSQK
jgi:hypothetical protein